MFPKHDGFAVLVQCLSEANIAIIIMETDDTREILRLLWHEVQAGLSCECPIVNPAADGGRLTLLVKIRVLLAVISNCPLLFIS